MKNLKIIIILSLCILLASCAVKQQKKIFSAPDTTTNFKRGGYVKKADNFLVILDSSSSMYEDYKYETKHSLALETANNLNKTIPNLAFHAGMRVFGPSYKPYGMTHYTKDGMSGAIGNVKDILGQSPLYMDIDGAADQLSSSPGSTAVIIISDGDDMDDKPVKSAAKIKKRYGDRLCIYSIQIGNSREGKVVLDEVSKAGECGFSINADQLSSGGEMARFVEKVFFEKDKDSDGDGVRNSKDKCPNTPRGTKVDAEGCTVKLAPMDSDRDGVIDSLDRCPNTPRGVRVDQYGCPMKPAITSTSLMVNFDFDKAVVKPEYHPQLKRFARFLKANPGVAAKLEGHTDNMGTEKYNMALSLRRANAVRQYLIEKYGVDGARLQTKGHGYTRPIADNKTEKGRALNRRTESTVRGTKN